MYIATLFTIEGRKRLEGVDPDVLKTLVLAQAEKVETWAWRIVCRESGTSWDQWISETQRSRFPGLNIQKENI